MAVSRRRFEMFQYRQVLARMRQGDSDRDIKRARLMGRPKAAVSRPNIQRQYPVRKSRVFSGAMRFDLGRHGRRMSD